MLLRILFLIGILYIIFRVHRFMKQIKGAMNRNLSDMAGHKVEDIMIQDPVCKIYFPQREGIHLNDNGKDLYFCSEACRERYINGERD